MDSEMIKAILGFATSIVGLITAVVNRKGTVTTTRSDQNRNYSTGSRLAFWLGVLLVVGGLGFAGLMLTVGGVAQHLEDAKIHKAKVDCKGLVQAAEAYTIANNAQPPTSIQQLSEQQPSGGPPFVTPDKIVDPWGKVYQLDFDGTNFKFRVFTIAPSGVTISNLDTK